MDPATITAIADLIGKLGFPIFVAGYLLVRTEPLLRNINETLVKLMTLIEHKL